MKLVFLDSTAVVPTGPGSPAYFSRYLIAHLKSQGHDVTITNGFFPDLCRTADAVIAEWANDDALEAADSGLCKKLIVRLRGYEAFGPLERLKWANVDALVYESPFLKQLVEERFPGLCGFRSHVIPSGIDVANIPFKERGHGPVVAMVGRGVADKGFQLAFEWARQRNIQLHVGIALPEPRLLRYLEHTKPTNVTIHRDVKTAEWLDEIDANYLLSASSWESLGYTIAEAMAAGVKPLVHDTPGAKVNWPNAARWTSFGDLNQHTMLPDPSASSQYNSLAYRAFIESNLDAAKQSVKFEALLHAAPVNAQLQPPTAVELIGQVETALYASRLDMADATLLAFRDRAPRMAGLDDHRSGLALKLAAAYLDAGNVALARVWALRSLGDVVRKDTLCLLGEVAIAEGDWEGARSWYNVGAVTPAEPTRYPTRGLADHGQIDARWKEILEEVRPKLPLANPPDRLLVVVAVRNAAKYITACLASIEAQKSASFAQHTPSIAFHCVVVDDASTDETLGRTIVDLYEYKKRLGDRFTLVQNGERRHSLRNIVDTIRQHGRPGDVVVIVDGDDQLLPGALRAIRDAYADGAWMTYGNFRTATGRANWMPPYPQHVVKAGSYRTWPWCVSHPKTFKIELFNKLTDEDFTHEGKWFQTAGDVALMIPMLEMAAERAVYIREPLYVWNDENALSDHRVDPDGQVRVRNLILSKPKRERLEGL